MQVLVGLTWTKFKTTILLSLANKAAQSVLLPYRKSAVWSKHVQSSLKIIPTCWRKQPSGATQSCWTAHTLSVRTNLSSIALYSAFRCAWPKKAGSTSRDRTAWVDRRYQGLQEGIFHGQGGLNRLNLTMAVQSMVSHVLCWCSPVGLSTMSVQSRVYRRIQPSISLIYRKFWTGHSLTQNRNGTERRYCLMTKNNAVWHAASSK